MTCVSGKERPSISLWEQKQSHVLYTDTPPTWLTFPAWPRWAFEFKISGLGYRKPLN